MTNIMYDHGLDLTTCGCRHSIYKGEYSMLYCESILVSLQVVISWRDFDSLTRQEAL